MFLTLPSTLTPEDLHGRFNFRTVVLTVVGVVMGVVSEMGGVAWFFLGSDSSSLSADCSNFLEVKIK